MVTRRRLPSLLAILNLSFLLLCSSCSSFIPEEDLRQDRLDGATPPLDGAHSLTQTFTSARPCLSEIELLPAVYSPNSTGTIRWLLIALNGPTVVSQATIDVASIAANQPLAISFPVQGDSAGQAYRLELEGSNGVQVGFWRTSFDSLDPGELVVDGGSPTGDLRLITRGHYTLSVLLQQTLSSWLPRLWLLLPLILLLVIPGQILGWVLGLEWDDPLVNWSVRITLSLAVVPVVLLWTSLLGLHWQRGSCLVIYSLLGLIAVVAGVRTHFDGLRGLFRREHRRAAGALILILLATLLLRLIQIRNLVLPAWVDSPQHVLITQLVANQGVVPSSYQPLLPVESFYYHYGFHSVTAVFAWLSGLAIPDAMLVLGQVISVLCSFSVYAFGAYLFRRRLVGLVAALLTGLVSYLPGYYVSWGRYTQLAGIALMPIAAISAIEWLRSSKHDTRLLLLAGLLNAGLFLTHARVAVFGACLLAAYLLIESVACFRSRSGLSVRSLWARAVGLIGCSLVLCLPWLIRLARVLPAAVESSASNVADTAYNALPMGLLLIRNNRQLFVIAALGVLLGLRRFRHEVGTILLACLLVALIVNPVWIGLPSTNLVNNASAVIALFLPLSVLGGLFFSELPLQLSSLLANLCPGHSSREQQVLFVRNTLLVALAIYALITAWGMVSVVNPDTVLATAADLRAMQWIRANTPLDSLFLINTRYWQLDMYVGTDGGYWILPLTGRRTLLPVLPYVFGQADYVQHTANLARMVSDVKDADSPAFLELLRQEGVTHVYVGARGGPLQPQMLLASHNYQAIYESGAVWIFQVQH